MALEIRNCPFCGSKAELVDWEDRPNKLSVNCIDDENCGAVLAINYSTPRQAIEAWNKRKEDTHGRKE